VQHVVATRNRFAPAGILFKLGGKELQAIARLCPALLQHGAHVGLTIQTAHGGADLVARREQLHDAIAADEARSAGH
jgi:hypothetical protein